MFRLDDTAKADAHATPHLLLDADLYRRRAHTSMLLDLDAQGAEHRVRPAGVHGIRPIKIVRNEISHEAMMPERAIVRRAEHLDLLRQVMEGQVLLRCLRAD